MSSSDVASAATGLKGGEDVAPIQDGLQWSAGFSRTWIHRSLAVSPKHSSNPENSPSAKSTRTAVKAVFYHSFISSIFDAHKQVKLSLENEVIDRQIKKYGRQLPRVNDSMHGYWRDSFLSPMADASLSQAWKAFTGDIGKPAHADELVLITEELYKGFGETRHHFSVTPVTGTDSQDVLIFAAHHWRTLPIDRISCHDYFLALDEAPYTTLLDFLARLHVIASPKYMAVAPDGRLFLSDSLEMLYSPEDATEDTSARTKYVEILKYLLEHPELTKDLQPIVIRGPQGMADGSNLVTPTQLRKVLQALGRAFCDWESPILNLDWSSRLQNYLGKIFPRFCKAAVDMAVVACSKDRQTESEIKMREGGSNAFHVRFSGKPLSGQHIVFQSRRVSDPEPVADDNAYILCSVRARIDSMFCGCSPYESYGNGSHLIGFDTVVRGRDAPHAEILCSQIEQLFGGDLAMNKDGPQSSEPILMSACRILYHLRELNLIDDDNFEQDSLAVINIEDQPRKIWPLLARVWSGKPLVELHNYLMKPHGQPSSYDQPAEITISKLTVVCLTCCVMAILHEAHFWKDRKASILSNSKFFKEAFLDVPEASLVVNMVLKALNTADASLLQAVLGTVYEHRDYDLYGNAFRSVVARHPLIESSTPDTIARRNDPECSCVICVMVAMTQVHGTWRTDLLRPDHLVSRLPSTLLRAPLAGATELLAMLSTARRAFLSQRNSNYVLHNAPSAHETESQFNMSIRDSVISANPLPHEGDRRIHSYTQQFDNDNNAPGLTPDETIEAYWNGSNQAAVERVKSAMIIGAQSTNIDMGSFGEFSSSSESAEGKERLLRQAKFQFPGWLCEMIVREAHGHIPVGSSHWAAVRAVRLAPLTSTSGAKTRGSTIAVDDESKEDDSSALPRIPSKHSIIQPHPAYIWPLVSTPQVDDIVLLDTQEQKRICCTLTSIATLQPRPVFVSHVWETSSHPDPTGRQMTRILQQKHRYLWLDYACLPQGPRNPSEQSRFRHTLHKLSALQILMTTIVIEDAHDRQEWERRGWTIVEGLVGNLPSPFSQAVLRHFKEHDQLADIFLRLRVHVTNQSDIAVLEMVLRDWLKSQTEAVTTVSTLPTAAFPLVYDVGIQPEPQRLAQTQGQIAAEEWRSAEVENLLRSLGISQAEILSMMRP